MHSVLTKIFIIGLVLLAACTSSLVTEIASTPTLPPTLTPTTVARLVPTDTPTQVPSPTLKAIPTHTVSPSPTQPPTPANTAIPLPTQTPTQTPAPTETFTPTIGPSPTLPVPTATPILARTVRVGLHGRNSVYFDELDYQLIREAKIETLKMMSFTDPSVFARIQAENPGIEFIVRMWDDRINIDGHPSPQEFAERMIPVMESLQPYVTKFEVGNEPNHFRRYEGWGPEEADAISFNRWFLEVYDVLKTAHPWAELGFPALGTPDSVHRDKTWLALTGEAINRADWLGVHCYWQTAPDGTTTIASEERGLCFKYYHALFPDKPIELTEFDNDNIYYDLAPISDEQMAREYVEYYRELFKYTYIRSASSFIMSSADTNWDVFAWRREDGTFKPVVKAVGQMARPALVDQVDRP